MQRAQRVTSTEFITVAKEIECIHDKPVISSSKEMIQDAIACIQVWKTCLPLGGVGIWDIVHLCTVALEVGDGGGGEDVVPTTGLLPFVLHHRRRQCARGCERTRLEAFCSRGT